ncbi:PREDICTED: uncharacterized protein LOC106818230 [Priapulus caudatus]|uniref:Uncharacterized protein LOC106818230 n=1 Tax=Priapulus caudatus TaxID=37621 RepID=A0ABM1F1X0_PRICU|nr:PREDICTED: uncharacterized protein LOC106818230 [Priapulus caudatus]
MHIIMAVAVQADSLKQRGTKYFTLEYATDDADNFTTYMGFGNEAKIIDGQPQARQTTRCCCAGFPLPITAQYVRLLPIQAADNNGIGLRMDLYGYEWSDRDRSCDTHWQLESYVGWQLGDYGYRAEQPTLADCHTECLHLKPFPCRSLNYDDVTQLCTLNNGTAVTKRGQYEQTTAADVNLGNYYELTCQPRCKEDFNVITSGMCDFIDDVSVRNLGSGDVAACKQLCLSETLFTCRSFNYNRVTPACELFQQTYLKQHLTCTDQAIYDYYEKTSGCPEYP